MDIVRQFKNAIAVIDQIKREEWGFRGHYDYDFSPRFRCYVATRNGIELWLASGATCCRIRDRPWELGIFGILVWYCGAGKRARALEKKMRRRPSDLSV